MNATIIINVFATSGELVGKTQVNTDDFLPETTQLESVAKGYAEDYGKKYGYYNIVRKIERR